MPVKAILLLTIVTAVLFLNSCSSVMTRTAHLERVEANLQVGNFEAAIQELESVKGKAYQAKDRVLYYLDLGFLHHYAGNYEKSNELLSEAERAIEELFTSSVSRAATSLMLNDNVLEYSGEDFEDIYINIFKALNYLQLGEFDSAFVEIRKINEKLNLLEDKYRDLANAYQRADEAEIEFEAGTSRFHNSILGRYLSMLIYRTEGQDDAARIDYNHIINGWREQANIYDFNRPELTSHLSATDNARLNFVCFAGKAPYKKAFERRITTFENHLIVSGNEPESFLHTVLWPGISKDYHFKFSLPFMQRRNSNVSNIRVYIDNRFTLELEKIEDVGNIAIETFSVKAPLIYFRSLTRSVVKGLLAEKAKSEMKSRTGGGITGALLGLATDIAVDISENADLRSSRFLPGKALIGEIELEPGNYDIRIDYRNSYGNVLFSDNYKEYEVKRGDLNLINSFYLN